MRAVKYFIRDYEQSTGQRLVGFRRHVNSFIAGGGNAPSAQKPYTPQEAQAAQDIIDGLKHYAKTFNPNNETQNKELQKLKPLLLLPDATGLPMQVVGKYGIQTKFDSWEDVKQFLLKHKDFCLDPERKSDFANVLTNDTCSQDTVQLVKDIIHAIDAIDETTSHVSPPSIGHIPDHFKGEDPHETTYPEFREDLQKEIHRKESI